MSRLITFDNSDPRDRGWAYPSIGLFPKNSADPFPGVAGGPDSIYGPPMSKGLATIPTAANGKIAWQLAAQLRYPNGPRDNDHAEEIRAELLREVSLHEIYCSSGHLVENLTHIEALRITDDELRALALDPNRQSDPRWNPIWESVMGGKRAITMLPIPGWPPLIVYRTLIDFELFREGQREGLIHTTPTDKFEVPTARVLFRSPQVQMAIEILRQNPKKFGAAALALAGAAVTVLNLTDRF